MAVLFNILFVFIPLLFFKTTSELFEFNKIVFLYAMTTLIVTIWVYQSIAQRKFIFRRTILDIPLVIYLIIYLITTILSIDPRTSIFGYYSRFNGGLISQICYSLLYWAFVSNIKKEQLKTVLLYGLLGTLTASVLAILEHFGIYTTCGIMKLGWTESCWVQDVKTRVFSTLGQPNWLAAIVVIFLPITWSKILNSNKLENYILWLTGSTLLFTTLLFTRSRSGLLAFGIEYIIFWGINLYLVKSKAFKQFLSLTFLFALIYLVFQSPFTGRGIPSSPPTGPALEVGGTESGTIRKYVWIGALNIFKNHPILGTGPETFAYTFSSFKPLGHNLTSEWDFIYNKAHNEYLNYLANTGLLGFLSYLAIIISSLFILLKLKKYDFLAGYIGILITNFFGFSVVPISLLFFLLPAFATVSMSETEKNIKTKNLNTFQRFIVFILLVISTLILFMIVRYWLADVYYNKARMYNKTGNQTLAKQEINKALEISKNESLYLNELAIATTNTEEAQKALLLSPRNINFIRSLASIYSKNNKLDEAIKTLIESSKIFENDPKNYFQLGIYYIKANDLKSAANYFDKAIKLKPNYKDARFALGLTYIDLFEFDKATAELKYILENIDPKDELTQKYLHNLNEARK